MAEDTCECFDTQCPIHPGQPCHDEAVTTLYRIDMMDRSGTRFCEGCAEDAMGSGLFTNEAIDFVREVDQRI